MLYVMSWAGENGHQAYSTSSVAVSGRNTKFLGAAFSAEPAAPLQLLLLLKYMLKSYQDIGDLEYNAHANIKKYNGKTWYTQQDLIQTRLKQTKSDIQQIVDIFPPFSILNLTERVREPVGSVSFSRWWIRCANRKHLKLPAVFWFCVRWNRAATRARGCELESAECRWNINDWARSSP